MYQFLVHAAVKVDRQLSHIRKYMCALRVQAKIQLSFINILIELTLWTIARLRKEVNRHRRISTGEWENHWIYLYDAQRHAYTHTHTQMLFTAILDCARVYWTSRGRTQSCTKSCWCKHLNFINTAHSLWDARDTHWQKNVATTTTHALVSIYAKTSPNGRMGKSAHTI